MSETDAKSPAKKAKAKGPSPFMAQYLEIKAEHPEALLFFRMGDFYELFFDDAVDAADILGITLTSRGEHDGKPIPMAGVPYHSAEGYLANLIKSGRRIAVCEQLESPADAKKRGYKAVVKRGVVRIVTPGTVTEDAILPAREGQALAAIGIARGGAEAGLAVCDVSTGAFEVVPVEPELLADALSALPAREVIVSEADLERPLVEMAAGVTLAATTPRPSRNASAKTGEDLLKEAFSVKSIDAFGVFSKAELSAVALLLDYVKLTQAGTDIRLDPPRRQLGSGYLVIDPATRASLEIDRALSGGRQGTLLATVDRTLTSPGARLLADRIARPSVNADDITARHEAVSWFLEDADLRSAIRRELKAAPDLERARTRLRLGRGGPRDLRAIGLALKHGERAVVELSRRMMKPPGLLEQASGALTLSKHAELSALCVDLSRAITDEPPALARDGGFVAAGWDAALDEVRSLRDNARKVIAEMQGRYADQTGISALKIKFNNVLGYFIDVTARHADPLMTAPLNETFIHRQTLANNVRFSTTELSDLAGKISRAEEEAKARELAVFEAFVQRIEALSSDLAAAGYALAEIDVASANAEWADEVSAVRPHFADAPVFEAAALRHPVVEAALRKDGGGFTANDLLLDARGETAPRLSLITGPNMAGKSTYLRQSVLAVILAQAGCFVPAKELTLGLVDRVFSRVGASDDLAKGRSTFMVEMVETAAILNLATENSFVILDEVGRGTSTYDGLAIAWAAVEYLHETNACRALFATHYHELTQLAEDMPHAANASLRAKEWKDELIFLHEVQAGPADRSYGVQVAKLAGLPKRAVRRAEQVLKRLEADPKDAGSLPLFAAAIEEPEPVAETSASDTLLSQIDPDTLTPREALELVYKLKILSS